jgi:hypothetical protein
VSQAVNRFFQLLGKTVYWLVLAAILLILPVFQSWEFLPEGGYWRILKLTLLGAVALIPIITKRQRSLHLVALTILVISGLFLFMLNQGIIKEPASKADLRILLLTKELLANESAWDRSGSLECSEKPRMFTLYCALREASVREAGTFRHRRPALQVVRAEIENLKPHAKYDHRLSGFISDASVNFSELHQVLDASIKRVTSDLHKS